MCTDVVYLASSTVEKDTLLTDSEEQAAGVLATSQCSEVIRFMLSLNIGVDFSVTKNLNEFLYTSRTGRIQPELELLHASTGIVASMQKYEHARSVGFHLLDRGPKWTCCRLSDAQRVNRTLSNRLSAFTAAYVGVELQLMRHTYRATKV